MKEVKTPKKPLIYYYGIVLLVLIVFNLVVSPILMEHQVEETDYGTFMSMIDAKNIGEVEVEDNQIVFTDKNNEKIYKRVVIGRIYAHYESTNGSSGSYGLGVPDWLKQPKAGDTTDSFKWYVLATIFAMGAGGLVLIGRRKGKKKDDEA